MPDGRKCQSPLPEEWLLRVAGGVPVLSHRRQAQASSAQQCDTSMGTNLSSSLIALTSSDQLSGWGLEETWSWKMLTFRCFSDSENTAIAVTWHCCLCLWWHPRQKRNCISSLSEVQTAQRSTLVAAAGHCSRTLALQGCGTPQKTLLAPCLVSSGCKYIL